MKGLRLEDAPVLSELLMGCDLKFVDVGGRGSALAQLAPLARVASYFSCEPDAEEAARLREQLPQDAPWRSVTVMPEALASAEGTARLFLTRKGGMSSLLEPDPAVTQRVYEGRVFEVVNVAEVPTISLARAASQYGFADACFLKLDTQGTELDILRSGEALVADSVLGVYVESLFHPFYRGQSLFADVDAFLRAKGFSLFGLYRTSLRRAGHKPQLYSRRMIVWAHCLYLREPLTLVGAHRSHEKRDVLRLLALTLAFEHFDLSFELLTLARERNLFPTAQLDAVAAEVESAVQNQTRQALRRARRTLQNAAADEAGLDEAVLGRSERDERSK